MDKYKRLNQLRAIWKTASVEERKRIEQEAAILKQTTEYQCYFEKNGVRCEKIQEDYWCSEEHKVLWQESNYTYKRVQGKRILSIREMQKRLLAMRDDSV